MCLWVSARTLKKERRKLRADWLFVIFRTRPVCGAWGFHAVTSGFCCYFANTFKHSFQLHFLDVVFGTFQIVCRLKCCVLSNRQLVIYLRISQDQRMCKALQSWCWNQKMESVSRSDKFSHLQWPMMFKNIIVVALFLFPAFWTVEYEWKPLRSICNRSIMLSEGKG